MRCVALAWRQSKPACFRLKSMMLKLFKIEQRKGKQRRGGPMGVYANGAALRAMAAVEQVHLVVISTFTGPSAGKGFKGHGRVIKGRVRSIEWPFIHLTTAGRFAVSSRGPTTSIRACATATRHRGCQQGETGASLRVPCLWLRVHSP